MGRSAWNKFQQVHAGLGLSPEEIRAKYHAQSGGTSSESCNSSTDHSSSAADSRHRNTHTRGSTSYSTPSSSTSSLSTSKPAASKAASNLSWNEFRNLYKGQKYSMEQLGKMYQQAKQSSNLQRTSSTESGVYPKNGKAPTTATNSDEYSDVSSYTSNAYDSDGDQAAGHVHPAVSRSSSISSLSSRSTHTDNQGHQRVMATNLSATKISKHWNKPVIIWKDGDLVADRRDLLASVPTEEGIYMFQARAPDARCWSNVYLGKGEGQCGIQGRVGAYIRNGQGIIAMASQDSQKYHAMLNLLHRGFVVRLYAKVTLTHTASESEARKLDEFKFPFNEKDNGDMRFVNFLIPETDKRVNDYPNVYTRQLNRVGARVAKYILCRTFHA